MNNHPLNEERLGKGKFFFDIKNFCLLSFAIFDNFFCLDPPGPEEDYKKKTRRNRTTFSNSQLTALEKVQLSKSLFRIYFLKVCTDLFSNIRIFSRNQLLICHDNDTLR